MPDDKITTSPTDWPGLGTPCLTPGNVAELPSDAVLLSGGAEAITSAQGEAIAGELKTQLATDVCVYRTLQRLVCRQLVVSKVFTTAEMELYFGSPLRDGESIGYTTPEVYLQVLVDWAAQQLRPMMSADGGLSLLHVPLIAYPIDDEATPLQMYRQYRAASLQALLEATLAQQQPAAQEGDHRFAATAVIQTVAYAVAAFCAVRRYRQVRQAELRLAMSKELREGV